MEAAGAAAGAGAGAVVAGCTGTGTGLDPGGPFGCTVVGPPGTPIKSGPSSTWVLTIASATMRPNTFCPYGLRWVRSSGVAPPLSGEGAPSGAVTTATPVS